MRHLLVHPVAILALSVALALGLTGCSDDGDSTAPPTDAPPFELSDFKSSETCAECHPNHFAEWSSSMHAYSFKDPVFFLAMFAEQENTGGELGQFCVSCHSPIGMLTGTTTDFFDPETMPDVVQEGVSCQVCHFMRDSSPEATEEGAHLALEPGDTMFGQLDAVETEGHRSEQRLVQAHSVICRGCHNLSLRGVGIEITFDEWENSIYASRGDSHCQDCHMPVYAGKAAVDGPDRENLHRHWFTGVDIAFTDFPDTAAARVRVEELLRGAAELIVSAPSAVTAGDTLEVTVTVDNDGTGHSLPSGASFARQMWVELTVTDAGATVLYRSGDLDANGDLRDANSELDPNGDPDLVLFSAVLLGENASSFTATGIEESMIPAGESRSATYRIPIALGTGGPLAVDVRLRFRPFSPYALRGLGGDELAALNPTFEMAEDSKSVTLR